MSITLEQALELMKRASSSVTKLADELAVARRRIYRGDTSPHLALLSQCENLFNSLSADTRFDLIGQNLCIIFAQLSLQTKGLSTNWNPSAFIGHTLAIEDLASNLLDAYEHRTRSHDEPRRMDLINYLIQKFRYVRYLEIGCNDDSCFRVIDVPHKVGVDPVTGGTLRLTSDEYFAKHSDNFDIIFIDGLHRAEQVSKDIDNALRVLNPNGTILMHDCNPRFEIRQIVPERTGVWNGDVWKSFLDLRRRQDLDCAVANFDHGCGVIRPRTNTDPINQDTIDWNTFSEDKAKYLRLMSFEQIREWT